MKWKIKITQFIQKKVEKKENSKNRINRKQITRYKLVNYNIHFKCL